MSQCSVGHINTWLAVRRMGILPKAFLPVVVDVDESLVHRVGSAFQVSAAPRLDLRSHYVNGLWTLWYNDNKTNVQQSSLDYGS